MDKVDIARYSSDKQYELDLMEAKTNREEALIRIKADSRNKFILQVTMSSIAVLAAYALFITTVSDTVKSHAKDILIFLGGGTAGYVAKKSDSEK